MDSPPPTLVHQRGGGQIFGGRMEARVDGAILQLNASKSRSETIPYTAVAADAKHDHIVASADGLGRVTIFNLNRNRFTTWRVAGEAIVALCFVSHGKELCASLSDGTVLCLNVADGGLAARLLDKRQDDAGAVNRVSVTTTTDGNGSIVATYNSNCVVVWDAAYSWRQVRKLGAPVKSNVVAVRLFDDLVLVLFNNDCILAWSMEDYNIRFQLRVSEGSAGLTCFAATENLVVAGGSNAMLYFWDTTSEVLLRVVEMPSSCNVVVQVEILSKNAQIAVLGDDGRLLILSSTASSCVVDVDFSAGPSAFPVVAFAVGARDHYIIAMSTDTPSACCKIYDLLAARRHAHELRRARKRLPKAFDASLYVRAPFGLSPAPSSRHGETSREGKSNKTRFRTVQPSLMPGDEQLKSRGDAIKNRSLAPPYRLARLGAIEKQLNVQRIQALLKSRGCLPKKYRTLIWRFLLQLPENQDSFTALLGKGIHPAYIDLPARYPLRDSRVLRKLQLVLSALAYWSPMCGELEYLPSTVFPFVRVFEADDLGAFEISMSVLLHWEREFLCTFPHPPIPLLSAVERALRIHDSELVDKLVWLGTGPQIYAWPLLRSAFSGVLGVEEWLQLWDHIFAWRNSPQLLLLAVVAYLLTHRSSLLTMGSKSEVEQYVQTEHCMNMAGFISKMHALLNHSLTHDIFGKAVLYIASKDQDDGSAEVQGDKSASNLLGVLSRASSAAHWPIPEGSYPPLRGYPKFVMDFQLAERRRIAAEEEEIKYKKFLIDDVKRRTEELLQQEEEWQAHEKSINAAEELRRVRASEARGKSLRDAADLESKYQQAQKDHIYVMENASSVSCL